MVDKIVDKIVSKLVKKIVHDGQWWIRVIDKRLTIDHDEIGWLIVVDKLVNHGTWWLMIGDQRATYGKPGSVSGRNVTDGADVKRASTNGGFSISSNYQSPRKLQGTDLGDASCLVFLYFQLFRFKMFLSYACHAKFCSRYLHM